MTTSKQGSPKAPLPGDVNSTSPFMAQLASTSGAGGTNPFQYQPRVVTSTSTQQTSQPDIEAIVNSAMQQLTGRFATPEEIAKYGAELLAMERANPSTGTRILTYDPMTGKGLTGTDTSTQVGVSPVDMITSLIRGTGEARDYQAATGFMDAMQQSNNKFRSAFSG